MSAAKRPPRGSWSSWRDQPRGPKPAPPAHGIKIANAGTTWWGRRWIEALEKISPDYASRLGRGKTYARTGRAHDLVVKPGKVTAKVTGSRTEPYVITIEMRPLDDATWDKALAELAGKARYAAQLLAGEMPEDVDEVLRKVGVRIFPSKAGDLTTSCSCPDWANPCKHVAATHYVLGDAFDKDPFLLFELRGRTRDRVLASMRPRGAKKTRDAETRTRARAPAGVKLGKIGEDAYDRWREGVPSLRLGFATPASDAAVIAALGAPPSWREKTTPASMLAPLVRAAAERARAIALRATEHIIEEESDGSPSHEPPPSREAPGK
ncbi:MAG: hypothetical protein JWP87_5354 [Labilithrix sp.]|nr:hypothetical protein [Labilithrix sp.]